MGYSWWRNIFIILLGQVGGVSSIFLIESQFGGVLGSIGLYCNIFRRIRAGIGFQGGVRFFSLVSGRIRSDILGCVFHDSSIRLNSDISFGSNIGLNCSNFTDCLVLSSIGAMVCWLIGSLVRGDICAQIWCKIWGNVGCFIQNGALVLDGKSNVFGNVLEGSHVLGLVGSVVRSDICGHINGSVLFNKSCLGFVQVNMSWGRSIDGGVLWRVSSGICWNILTCSLVLLFV